jgi:hypothetical protein
MNKMILAACCVLALSGCSNEYIIGTTDGRLISADGKPELDETTGMYRYEDSDGYEQHIERSSVKQIMER